MKQIEALADGIMDAALTSVREQARPVAQQSETELLRQREKISRSRTGASSSSEGKIATDSLNLATIAIACAIGYLNFRRVSRLVRRPSAAGEARRNALPARASPVPNRQRLDAGYNTSRQEAVQSLHMLTPSPVGRG